MSGLDKLQAVPLICMARRFHDTIAYNYTYGNPLPKHQILHVHVHLLQWQFGAAKLSSYNMLGCLDRLVPRPTHP